MKNPLKFPSYFEMLKNFSSTMGRWILAGFPIATEETLKKRHSICKICEFAVLDRHECFARCRKCGCCQPKLWLDTATCADNPQRW